MPPATGDDRAVNSAQLLYSGIVIGSFYALVTMGYVLVFRVSGVFNFSHPAVMLIGAFTFERVVGDGSWPAFIFGLLAASAAGAGTAAACSLGVMRFMVGRPHFVQMIVTFGLSITLVDLAQLQFGTVARNIHLPFSRYPVSLPLGIGTDTVEIAVFITSIVVVGLVIWLASSTSIGSRVRAVSEDAALASYAGIRVGSILTATWALAGVLAAVAGIAFAARIDVDVSMVDIGLAAFPAAMLGGMDSPGGTLIGGISLAVLQGVAVTWFGSSIAEPIGFIALLILLLVRPYGLFGLRPVERV
jgi:branched-chain amino acid transport system permease protein